MKITIGFKSDNARTGREDLKPAAKITHAFSLAIKYLGEFILIIEQKHKTKKREGGGLNEIA